MKKIFLEDEPDLEIFLRQNSNSRRITLRISALDGKSQLQAQIILNLQNLKNLLKVKNLG